MAKILKADGTEVELTGEGPRGTLTLKQLRDAVAGPGQKDPCLSILRQEVLKDGALLGSRKQGDYVRHHLVVNDDGHSLRLPHNTEATFLYQSTRPGCTDPIVGNVVLAEMGEIE